MCEDITFCTNDNCKLTACYRNPKNISNKEIPHSYSDFEGILGCPYLDYEAIGIHTKNSKKSMDETTQEFICRLKRGQDLEEALEAMTYGYRDDKDIYHVDKKSLLLQFFYDYLNYCDNPGNVIREIVTNSDIYYTTTEKNPDYISAVITALTSARVRNDAGYCNGFNFKYDSIEREVNNGLH